MTNIFKKKHTYEKRIQESNNIMIKYPDRIPIIVEKYKDCNLQEIDKCKFLVPKDMSIGQFVYIIRKRIKLDSTQTLFIMINNKLPSSSKLVSQIYDNDKDEDGFLYVIYTNENTFG